MNRGQRRPRSGKRATGTAAVSFAAIVMVLVATAGLVSFLQTGTGRSASTTSRSQPSRGIYVKLARLVSPSLPAGPTVVLTLQNQEGCCVTSLTAVLRLNNNYTFTFAEVNGSHPLGQGQSVTDTQTLIGASLNTGTSYPLIIKGATQDTVFTYTTEVWISESPPY